MGIRFNGKFSRVVDAFGGNMGVFNLKELILILAATRFLSPFAAMIPAILCGDGYVDGFELPAAIKLLYSNPPGGEAVNHQQ